jgi:hypothetical protein
VVCHGGGRLDTDKGHHPVTLVMLAKGQLLWVLITASNR